MILQQTLAFSNFQYFANCMCQLLRIQGRNLLPKTGWVSKMRRIKILPSIVQAIALPAHPPVTPLSIFYHVFAIKIRKIKVQKTMVSLTPPIQCLSMPWLATLSNLNFYSRKEKKKRKICPPTVYAFNSELSKSLSRSTNL